jgi:hypothetical protein
MSIEAPITKVINIILATQENQPSYIAQALDKVGSLNLPFWLISSMENYDSVSVLTWPFSGC